MSKDRHLVMLMALQVSLWSSWSGQYMFLMFFLQAYSTLPLVCSRRLPSMQAGGVRIAEQKDQGTVKG
jgi:hypothetical protein